MAASTKVCQVQKVNKCNKWSSGSLAKWKKWPSAIIPNYPKLDQVYNEQSEKMIKFVFQVAK